MVVAPALPGEWAVVRELRLAALEDAPEAFCSTLEGERGLEEGAWRRKLDDPDRTTLVARYRREAAGMAVLGVWDEDGVEATADIGGVWVAPVGRGRGVGDALISSALGLARDRGLRRVLLEVGDHNVWAQELYARHGFTPTGRTSAMPPPKQHVTEHELARDL